MISPKVLESLARRHLKFCFTCRCKVYESGWERHCRSRNHTLLVHQNSKLRNLALQMWEKHRGSPILEDSPRVAEAGKILRSFTHSNVR